MHANATQAFNETKLSRGQAVAMTFIDLNKGPAEAVRRAPRHLAPSEKSGPAV